MSDETKKCPFCAETIKAEAIVCRYCGRDLNAPISLPSTATATKTKDVDEATILEVGDVKITNLRAIIGPKTYAMSNITSVSSEKKPQSSAPGLIIALSIILFIVGLTNTRDYMGCLVVAALLFVGAALTAFNAKPTYALKIGSSSGESNILESQDEAHVQSIVSAMNEAIVKKG